MRTDSRRGSFRSVRRAVHRQRPGRRRTTVHASPSDHRE